MEYRQFDVVRLIHTKNVRYMSGPPERATSPKGEWSIIGFIETDAILAKQSTVIRIPTSDIERIAEYDRQALVDRLKNTGKQRIDIVQEVSKILNITSDKARELCKKHKIPLIVDSKFYEQRAIERLRDAIGENRDE